MLKRILGWLLSCMAVISAEGGTWSLEQYPVSLIDPDWRQAKVGRAVNGAAMTMGVQTYTRGVGTHANSEIAIRLDGNAALSSAIVGPTDSHPGRPALVESSIEGAVERRTSNFEWGALGAREGTTGVPLQAGMPVSRQAMGTGIPFGHVKGPLGFSYRQECLCHARQWEWGPFGVREGTTGVQLQAGMPVSRQAMGSGSLWTSQSTNN